MKFAIAWAMPTSNERKMLSSNEALKELIRRVYNNYHENCINQKNKYWCLIEITVEIFYDVIFEWEWVLRKISPGVFKCML